MKVLYKNEPSKIKALQTMQKAYEIAIRNTRSPLGGGSDTAENVFSRLATLANHRPTSIVNGALRFLKKYSSQQIDKILTRAMFDPEYAQTLLDASRKGVDVTKMQKIIDNKIVNLNDYKLKKYGAVAAGMGAAYLGIQDGSSPVNK